MKQETIVNWKIVDWPGKKQIFKVTTQQDDLIADVYDKQNASLIVEAANNYKALKESNEALIEATKTVLSVLEDWNSNGFYYTNLIEHLKAALTKAKSLNQ